MSIPTIRNPRCEVCDLFMDNPDGADHEMCLEALCGMCDHTNGAHWTTNDGRWSGCADCNDCEGYAPVVEA